MSYARNSDESDIYVYASDRGFECVGCGVFQTRSEIISHIEEHARNGSMVGRSLDMLRAELSDHGETEFRPGDGT